MRPEGVDVVTPEVTASTSVSVAAGPLVAPVLRRVVGMLAARADLPLDRLDDAMLVTDMIANRAQKHVLGATVDVDMEPGVRSLSLRIGPLRAGGGRALVAEAAVPGVGNVIEQLSDEISVSDGPGGEYLLLRLAYAS